MRFSLFLFLLLLAPAISFAQSDTAAVVDVIVEPQTHVPSFYHGRALPSVGSIINMKALVFGANAPSNELIYNWEINDYAFGGSGLGQNAISFNTPLGTQMSVSLSVSNLLGDVVAVRRFTIPIVSPVLRFYEVNTLYGINLTPLREFNLIGNSATILAEPYYLDSRVYNNPDSSVWDVGGTETRSYPNPYEMTFERTDYDGSARLGFEVRSTAALLQRAVGTMQVNY